MRPKALWRIAFRAEGEWVNAYYAEPNTMEGAILICSARKGCLQSTPGAFDDLQALARKIVSCAIADVGGTPPESWTTIIAPESERTGNA